MSVSVVSLVKETGYSSAAEIKTSVSSMLNVSVSNTDTGKPVEITKEITNQLSEINDFGESIKITTTDIGRILQDFTTEYSSDHETSSSQEVKISKAELHAHGEIGTAEKVVIGTAILIACVAVIAILLRILRRYCWWKSRKKRNSKDKIFGSDIFAPKLGAISMILNYFGTDIEERTSGSSQSQDCSQSTGSSPATDWSDISSAPTKSSSESSSTSDKTDLDMSEKSGHKSNRRLASDSRFIQVSTPRYGTNDRLTVQSSLNINQPMGDERISEPTTQSFRSEPLRLEDSYRKRWDDQWDPSGLLPRGNLSFHSHPSESRLSLNSLGSQCFSPSMFPIPTKEFVRQLQLDKQRKYPFNSKPSATAKKEKHVRLIIPNEDRTNNL